MNISVKAAERIEGTIEIPGDKSISHRAVMLGSISGGVTEAKNFLEGGDCLSTVNAFREMGVDIEVKGKNLRISGPGLKGLSRPQKDLYLGNSGTTMRLISGILAGQDFEARLTGDESLSKRPMERIMAPLRQMGADIASEAGNGSAPLRIRGRQLRPISYDLPVASAQVKSCILLAGLYADGKTSVTEPLQSRDHTERMLEYFGARISRSGLTTSVISGSNMPALTGRPIRVPGDISSAAFFMALAALLKGSRVVMKSVGINPTRRKIIDILKRMGADISLSTEEKYFEPVCDIRVNGGRLKGTTVLPGEIPQVIDEIPVLSVCAALAEGKTVIRGIRELRVKETDRVFSIVDNLARLGADVRSDNENLYISGRPGRFANAQLRSFGDHRTAMSMAVAACLSDGTCTIEDVDCVNTSFPNFFGLLETVKI
ncbi:MAG: 3-phosphoshikimate 1-carboxyvinyltransferase [Candidatus Omnitrophota bacterium]